MEVQSSLSKKDRIALEIKRDPALKNIKSNRVHNALQRIPNVFDRMRAKAHYLSGILSIEELEKGELM